ncbi:hypothetical protein [Crassaminicella indica]|uniref:Uncharacterized protein n=1 Tax=Crassaminicella indica TaxID=2855394 RepID=A0ABX8REQ1_9CLOT|nr:hypothetical protein [Crassaminicella indica]QXM05436.1 hypothetical protein KVH43_08560 [Crassaminicella indica]
MKKIQAINDILDDDFYELMDVVKLFLGFTQELLEKGIITKEQFDEMTAYKRKFINYVENEMHFENELTEECILQKNV